MIQFNAKTGSAHHKLENKSTGISTKNYVDLQPIEKMWVKTKTARLQKREHFQRYIYNTLLSISRANHRHLCLLSLQSLNVHVVADQKELNHLTFTIQRPFVDSSLKDLFESDTKYDSSTLGNSLFQLLRIFVQESGDPFAVICPSTLLAKKQWNKSFELFLNHTSLVGYHFLLENEPIFLSKFRQIYCYLHPRVLELRTQKIKIDFTCHLFSFSMNLFSLIIGKEVSHPLYANRSKITITADEAEPALRNNLLQMKKLIKSNVVRGELQKAAKSLGYQKNHFTKFFETVFGEENSQPFLTWVEVIDYFNKDFLEFLEEKTSAKVFQAMKQIYQQQSQDRKNAYARLGLIRNQNLQEHSKKELILYSLVRCNELKEVQFKPSRQPYYQSGLYKFYKKIELQALEYRLNRAQSHQQQEFNRTIEWDIESEVEEGLHFNVHSFEVEREEAIQGQKRATIYAVNDFQQTLNIYGSSLWL